MRYLLSAIAASALLLALGTPARADLAPPETTPCQGKQAGTVCTYNNAAGTCQNQTCSNPRGSYACIECITSATSTNTTTTTLTTNAGAEPPAAGDGACAIGKPLAIKRTAPWLLAGAFSLLFLFGRRRRR
jgi:hypothetical protein